MIKAYYLLGDNIDFKKNKNNKYYIILCFIIFMAFYL